MIILDDCIEQTINYCKERVAFGKRIIDNQALQFRLAELKTEIEALRSLIYRACESFVEGEDMTYLASMAKLKCGRLIREVSDTCLEGHHSIFQMSFKKSDRRFEKERN